MGSEIITIGELLIDFFCENRNVSLSEGTHFTKHAGGAPANVAATISKLGGDAAFVGKVGDDSFGQFLEKTLIDVGVDTSMLLKDQSVPTTLAFVSLTRTGERDFIFNRGADRLVTTEDLLYDRLMAAKIIHFGSATALLDEPFCETYLSLLGQAHDQGVFTSFDPNFRENLWQGNTDQFILKAKKAVACADFVKVSEEELQIITGTTDQQKGLSVLHQLGAKIITVTLGKQGTLLSDGQTHTIIPSIDITAVDSTGAGDAFVGAMLFQLANRRGRNLEDLVSFANKVGAIVCTKLGAIAAIPTFEQVMLHKED